MSQSTLFALGIDNAPASWLDNWDKAGVLYVEGKSELPTCEDILSANDLLGLPQGALDALCRAASQIGSDSNLSRLAWQWHYQFFHMPQDHLEDLGGWPLPTEVMQADSGLFPAIVLLSGLRHMLEIHESMGIDRQVTMDTLRDVRIWMEHFYEKNGVWGINEYLWVLNSLRASVYRLGRLQFQPDRFQWAFRVYKSLQTGKVIALAEPGVKFRSDGQVDGTNGVTDPDGAWVSEMGETEETIMGNPMSPLGFAIQEFIELKKKDWQLVLKKGDPTLWVHIAADGKMSYEACIDSFEQSKEFFPKHFPDSHFVAWACTSWLLDPQFPELLSSDSNIVRFLNEYYLVPILTDDKQTFERVFGEKPGDFTTAPRDTSVRRAILDHVLAGNHMRRGAGFILIDDFGTEGGGRALCLL